MRCIACFLCLFFFGAKSFATGQIPDKLIFNGTEHKLLSNPLEKYFEQFPEKKPEATASTALWRGYVATFEIIHQSLMLKDIVVYQNDPAANDNKEVSVLKSVFGSDLPFDCGFYNGMLVVADGEVVEYIHMGYASIYQDYTLLQINNGRLVRSSEMDYKEYLGYKNTQFREFKKTEAYKNLYDTMRKALSDVENDPTLLLEEADKKNKKKKANPYLEEKERNFRLDKEVENFIRIFNIEYTSIVLPE